MDQPQGRDEQVQIKPWPVVVKVACVVGALVLATIWFLPPVCSIPMEAVNRANCVSNMKLIGIGLQTYHDQYKCLPPPYLANGSGKPMHSWRVLLLPSMEDEALTKLYEQYNFNEPWNGPHNAKLAAKCPDVFRCPSDE